MGDPHFSTRARRRAGSSPAGCLVAIVFAIAAAFVGYNYFIKDYNLRHPDQMAQQLPEDNQGATNEFRIKMAREVLKDEQSTCRLIGQYYVDVANRRLPDKKVYSVYEQMRRRLAGHMESVAARASPSMYFDAHRRNAHGISHLYQCIVLLRQTPRVKDPKERERLLQDAWTEYVKGQRGIEHAVSVIRL
ncbi:MAG: hypothetical protein AB1758_01130 [Candidatus Eremiobacterota bacterium]